VLSTHALAAPPQLYVLEPRRQRAILRAPFKTTQLPDGTLWLLQYRRGSGYLLRFPRLADFAINHAATAVSCVPASGVSAATVEHLFLNQIVPLALSQQGRLVLHGSAVNSGGRALAFLGDSGQGKSTLAGHFASHGMPFLTDDGLFIDQLDDRARVVPGHRSIRLWADSESSLLPSSSQKADEVQFTSKGRFHADGVFKHCPDAIDLQCIYLLRKSGVDSVQISPMPAAAAFMALVNHSFLLDTESSEVLGRHFSQLQALIRTTKVFSLDYPRDFSQLPHVQNTVVAHADSLPDSVQ
jgi:hypothetical protein